jgi:hypothetical protein
MVSTVFLAHLLLGRKGVGGKPKVGETKGILAD